MRRGMRDEARRACGEACVMRRGVRVVKGAR